MAAPLELVINPIVSTHAFFTTYVGSTVSVADKRRLATKLLLYEIRGRPWDTSAADLKRFSNEWTLYAPRPQLAAAVTRLTSALSRFDTAYAPWSPGEGIFKRHREFPGAYWGYRFFSAVQLPFGRDLLRAFYGLPSGVVLSSAKVNRYKLLRKRPNSGYANHDRALMLLAENPADVATDLPAAALVLPPTF